MSLTGRDFPQRLSSSRGVFQCYPTWDGTPRQYHEWQPVGYFNVPILVGGHTTPSGNTIIGERADRQYVVRACRNCPEIWHQDITGASA